MNRIILPLLAIALVSCGSSGKAPSSDSGFGLIGSAPASVKSDTEKTVDKKDVVDELDMKELESLVSGEDFEETPQEVKNDEDVAYDEGYVREAIWIDVEPLENARMRYYVDHLSKSELYDANTAVRGNFNPYVLDVISAYENNFLSDDDIFLISTGLAGSMQNAQKRKYFVYILEGKDYGDNYNVARERLSENKLLSKDEVQLAEAMIDDKLPTEAKELIRESFKGHLKHNQRRMVRNYITNRFSPKFKEFIKEIVFEKAAVEKINLSRQYVSLKFDNKPYPVFKKKKMVLRRIRNYNPYRGVASTKDVPQGTSICNVEEKQRNFLASRGLDLLISTPSYCIGQKGSLIFRVNNCNPCR